MCVYLLLCSAVRVCVNCITLYWMICGKNKCRLIFGDGLVRHYNRTPFQTTDTNHETQMQVSWSLLKILLTAIYEFETGKTTRSVWQLRRHFVFLSNWAAFVICQPFNIIVRPATLCLRSAISMRNYFTNLQTQTQVRIFVCSLLHIPLDCPFR